MAKENATQVLGPRAEANVMVLGSDKLDGVNDEQWQMLLGPLNNAKPRASENLTGKCVFKRWIIDSGPSYHMTRQLELMSNL